MVTLTNVGGSLTTAAALTLLAWGVRFLRKKYNRGLLPHTVVGSDRHTGRFFSTLSPAALRMMVETDPIPHLVLDVRSAETAQAQPLPRELNLALHLPVEEVEAALAGGKSSWPARLREKAAPPSRDYLLVFVGDGEEQPRIAAAAAAARGFQRTAVLEGGLESFSNSHLLAQADLKYINRDAVALLLGLAGDMHKAEGVYVIDLRRNDERSLYGTIPGTVHVPTDEFAAALKMNAKQWKDAYRCPKPGPGDALVMQCRTNRRAAWAAQLALDHGLQNCLVYRQGAYGWRLSPTVKAYRSYEKWDPPPDPEHFQVEQVQVTAAKEELNQLGLLTK